MESFIKFPGEDPRYLKVKESLKAIEREHPEIFEGRMSDTNPSRPKNLDDYVFINFTKSSFGFHGEELPHDVKSKVVAAFREAYGNDDSLVENTSET